MKIIKNGKLKSKTFFAICKNPDCKCEFQCTFAEVEPFYDPYIAQLTSYFTKCPECKFKNTMLPLE